MLVDFYETAQVMGILKGYYPELVNERVLLSWFQNPNCTINTGNERQDRVYQSFVFHNFSVACRMGLCISYARSFSQPKPTNS